MRELPRANISKDFYMWFDLEEKKEHYATPLYLYQVKRDRINPSDETKLYLKLKKDISKVKTVKDKEIIRPNYKFQINNPTCLIRVLSHTMPTCIPKLTHQGLFLSQNPLKKLKRSKGKHISK